MRALIFAVVSVALLAAPVHAETAKAPPPACAGQDILTPMKASDPEGYAKIRAVADATPNANAVLWRIEGKGQPASYLFGTIHSTDVRVNKLPDAVTAAFNAASTAAFEYIDSDANAAGKPTIQELVAQKGFFAGGNGLKDILTPPEMKTLSGALAAEGIPENAAHLLKPWFAEIALALPVCEKLRAAAGLVALDKRLECEAIATGKKVVGLETAGLQIDALAGMPDDAQIKLLQATVATLELREDALEVLHRAYLARDLATQLPFTKRIVERAGYDPSAIDIMERDIATKRNYGMRDAALPLLKEGGAFIAVGALHLLGKEGLVELLRGEGYTVTAVE